MPLFGSKLIGRARGIVFGLLVICLSAGWETAHANQQYTLQFEQNDRDRPIATIVIDGVSTTALIDTGATIALIDQAYAPLPEVSAAAVPAARVLGIGGSRLYPIEQVPSMSVGALTWKGLSVAVNADQTLPGHRNIIPISMFRASVVDFEFKKSRVHLYDGPPKPVRGVRRTSIKYQEIHGLIFIPVRIRGVRGLALIDTGADASFVNQAFQIRARARPYRNEEEKMQGVDLTRNVAPVYRFRDLRFGKNQIKRFHTPVLDTDLFEELGFGDEPMMVMGMDLLNLFRLQIDRERKRVIFMHR